MNKSLFISVAIIVLLLVGAGVYFGMNSSPSNSQMTSNQPSSGGNNPSTSTGGNTPSTTTNPKTVTVAIQNFAFSPSTITINKGDTVVWTNMDSAVHTVTSDSGSELASSSLGNGQTYSHTFNTAGTFNYHCAIHPMMKATVIAH